MTSHRWDLPWAAGCALRDSKGVKLFLELAVHHVSEQVVSSSGLLLAQNVNGAMVWSCETLILQSERLLSLLALLNLVQERKHNVGVSFCKTLNLGVLRNQRHRWSTVLVLPGLGNYLTSPERQHKEEQPASSCGHPTGSTDHFGTWSSFPRGPLNFSFRVETLLT